MYGPLMSVSSGWISQRDVGKTKTTNGMGNDLYRQKANSTDEHPLRVESFTPFLSWIVALVLLVIFHVWLMKENQFPTMTKSISELSSSESISIQFTTLNPEKSVVEAKSKIESKAIFSDPVAPVKVIKPKPTVANKEKSKALERKSNKHITQDKKKHSNPDATSAFKITTQTPEKGVAQLNKTLPNNESSAEHIKLIRLKNTLKNSEVVKQKTILKVVETYESYPLIKKPQFLRPPSKSEYPRLAKMINQQGISIIRAKNSRFGTVDEARLHQTSGYDLLDKSAMSTLQHCQFKPVTKAGITMTAWVQVPVKFKLEN